MKFVVSHPVVLAGALALTGASFAFGCSSSDEGGDAAAQDALGAAGGSDDESEPESSASGTAAATTDPLPESSSGSTATIGDGPTMPSTSGPSLGPLPRAPGSVVRVDHGYPLIDPVDGVCPDNTVPSERFRCTDVEFCHCEYECAPGCAEGEVCGPTPDDADPTTCSCHAALQPTDAGCVWQGLLETEPDVAWTLDSTGEPEKSSATVVDGVVHLELFSRCASAAAGAVARLPSSDAHSSPMALVMDYEASGTPIDDGGITLSLRGVEHAPEFIADGEQHELRRCMSLSPFPQLAALELSVYAFGLCAEPLSLSLSFSNVRVEPDDTCRD